MHLSCTVFEL